MGCASSSAPVHGEHFVEGFGKGDRPFNLHKRFHQEYVLRGKLGKGAFAQVHLATRVAEPGELAVKITDLRGAMKNVTEDEVDVRTRRAVEKEVAILRRVGVQKHCVACYEDYMEGVFSYIIMERCDCTLLQALERFPELTENTLIRIVEEMLQALVGIHRLSIVHRDVKPDNFLCHGEGLSVKLCDFGLAEVLPNSSSELKGVYGTAPFMSPEMLSQQGYSAKTDVWSLGVIAYVLLLGQFPYQPIESTARAMKAAILTGVPEPTFRPRPSLDTGGASRVTPGAILFCQDLLHRDKQRRPTAAAALRHQWVAPTTKPAEQWSAPSLRPMLYAAKRAGAFDTRPVSVEDKSGMDRLLAALQAQQHGPPSQVPDGTRLVTVGRKGDKAHSECSMESTYAKAAKTDSTMAHSNVSHSSTATGSSGTSYQSKRSRSLASRDV